MTDPAAIVEITVDRVGPGGGVASDSAFGVAVVSLWQRCAESGDPAGFPLPVVRSDVAARTAALVDEIKTGRLIAVAANRARRLVGVAMLRPGRGTSQHTGQLALILVDPDHRRQGLGTQLVGTLLASATELGLERLDVQVTAGSGLERLMADRFEFAEFGRRPAWVRVAPGDDRDEVLLGTTLGAAR